MDDLFQDESTTKTVDDTELFQLIYLYLSLKWRLSNGFGS